MLSEVKIPEFGESISEATIAQWLKKEGDFVKIDEPLATLESDKVSVELLAPKEGILSNILNKAGDTVKVKQVVASIEQGQASKPNLPKPTPLDETIIPVSMKNDTIPPGAHNLILEHKLNAADIKGTGKHNQITKEDVVNHIATLSKPKENVAPVTTNTTTNVIQTTTSNSTDREKVVPMSRLRQAIAQRLVNAQSTAAILTTFNEVNMKPLMDLRNKYKDQFLAAHGVKLGFMSVFTKACVSALQMYPAINAEIRGTDIVYKNYYDIGVAVGGPKGLVVPIVRNADQLSLAGIEKEIARLSEKVKTATIALSDMEGGTFTISNGGVYGSMLSTPILNPPQTGILGMHNIVERPVVINGEIVIRPIMYLALSYDHRMVDGKEAVLFLVKVKEIIEDPARMLLSC